MTSASIQPSRDDVLMAFAVEDGPRRERLERYLRDFPDYAEDLIDLSRELSRDPCEDEEPLSADDGALIDAAWEIFVRAEAQAHDPFADLSPGDLRDLSRQLEVPRQVVMALREGRVLVTTVPRRFLARLAASLRTTIEVIEEHWGYSAQPQVRSYKAEGKPQAINAVSFERVLVEAGVPEEQRAQLMADVD